MSHQRRTDPLEDGRASSMTHGSRTRSTTSLFGPSANANNIHDNHATTSPTKSKKSRAGMSKMNRAVWFGRVFFVCFLLGVGGLTGYFLNRYLTEQEEELSEDQFSSIAERALQSALEVVTRKRLSMATMASLVSEQLSDASDWPYVTIQGYHRVSAMLSATGSHDNMGFAPLVEAGEPQQQWENFAYDYFDSRPDFPNTTAVNSFGKGIWRIQNGTRIHDSDQLTAERGRLFPVYQCCADNPSDPLLLFNLYSEKLRMRAIDGIFSCVEQLTQDYGDDTTTPFPDLFCGTMTDHVTIVRLAHRGPASMMFQPVFPAKDPRQLVGLIASPIIWDEIFENVFNKDVDGVDCVLESETKVHTYNIAKGKVESFAEGALQQTHLQHLGQMVNLTPAELHEIGAPMYKLAMYPSDDFQKTYSTDNPRNGAIVAVSVMIFAAILFLLYDYFVRREFEERKNLLDAKRQFMRFISHEVRTPLNAVVMGLNVLKSELQGLFESGEEIVQRRRSMDHQPTKQREEVSQRRRSMDHQPIEKGSSQSSIKSGSFKIESKGGSGILEANPLQEEKRVDLEPSSSTRRMSLRGSGVNNRGFRECMGLLDEIQKGTNAAVAVLNDVLNYDKIEHKSLKLELSLLPVWQDFERTIAEFRIPAAKKDVSLNTVFEPLHTETLSFRDVERATLSRSEDLPDAVKNLCLVGDSSRMAQVLRNIISNALKFTAAGGSIEAKLGFNPLQDHDKRKRVEKFKLNSGREVALERQGTVEYRITDTGAGMSEAQLQSLFGEGVQFNANQLQAGQGSGLGLYISKGIVEQHEGTIGAESEGLGHGTSFTVLLPIYAFPADQDLEDSHLDQRGVGSTVSTSSAGAEKLRLLVVDDALSNRKFLVRLLSKKGHECDQAENGQEAVDLVKKSMEEGNAYSSILMDFEMPIMDGPTATSEIRQMGCGVFVVGITGNMLSEDVEYFKTKGANAVLPKPLQISVLEEVLIENGILASST